MSEPRYRVKSSGHRYVYEESKAGTYTLERAMDRCAKLNGPHWTCKETYPNGRWSPCLSDTARGYWSGYGYTLKKL